MISVNKPAASIFSNIGFLRQLSLVFTLGIFILALVTAVVVSKIATDALRERMIGEGVQLSLELAEQSKLALLYESEENAEDAASILNSFNDVVGIQILDRAMQPLYSRTEFSDFGDNPPIDLINNVVLAENDSVWQFIAPVKIASPGDPSEDADPREETIGFVRIVMTKASLKKTANDVFQTNLFISIGLATLLLIVLLIISRRLLHPISHLAEVMSSAQKGEHVNKVNIHGPRDIREMFLAFNSMMDILRKREFELQKSRDEAYQLAKMKGEFAANVSHELRTPMNGVLGMLEMLSDSSLSGRDREYLTVAKNSAKSLLLLINDILDFSKSEAGKTILEEEDFDLYDQIDEVVALLGTQTQQKQIDFSYYLHENMPRCYRGDVNRIRQLLINLTNNAIKFTEKGFVSIEASLVGDQDSEECCKLRFDIRDSGIGIPLEKQTQIFSAFSQADGTTTRKYGGTGLGLSICKQLVELMQGDIGVESRPGKGSNFWFTVQLKASATSKKPRSVLNNGVALKVLVVDSNPGMRKSLEWMINRSNNICQQAASYANAIKLVNSSAQEATPFDLVIIDRHLNENLYKDLINHIHNKSAVTLCAVMDYHISELESDNKGCSCLTKPIIYSHLLNVLERAANHSQENKKTEAESLSSKTEAEIIFPEAKVLVVDDNPVNQLVAVGLLEPFQCEIDTAVNGIECLAKLEHQHYDLILMDCNMPELDGYKASERIRAEEKEGQHIIIVAITANAGPGDRERCLDAGMDDYLFKPFNRDELKAKLIRWLPSLQYCRLQ